MSTQFSMSIWRAAALAGLGLLSACGGGGGGVSDDSLVNFDATAMNANLADEVITAGYVALDDAAAALALAIDALADGEATEAELDAAQLAWKATRVPWESSEAHLFGPVDAQGIDPLIDTWPLATTDLQQFLSQGATSVEQLLNASANVQGFHAIEYLLFGDGVEVNDQPVASIDADELAYLVSLSDVLQIHTADLAYAWTDQYDPDNDASGPYADQLKSPGVGKVYTSQGAVVEELINGLITIVDEVANGKIGEPLGASLAEADTSLVESQYSWNSLTDFHNNLQSAVNLYTGVRGFDPQTRSPSTADNGIYAFVAAHSVVLADDVYAQLVAAYDAIALIDGDGDVSTTNIDSDDQIPFRQAIKDEAGRQRCEQAIAELGELLSLLQGSVLPLVQVTEFAG